MATVIVILVTLFGYMSPKAVRPGRRVGRIRVSKDHRTFVRRDELNQLIDTLNDRAEVST
jgi:hypothetical protein